MKSLRINQARFDGLLEGSHSPNEFTDWQDCYNGANVLLQIATELSG